MAQLIEPYAIDVWQQVMCHVLLVADLLAVGQRACESPCNEAPIRLVEALNLVRSGVRGSGLTQPMSVERLVEDNGVGTTAEGSEKGGRDVPWTRPHGDAKSSRH